MLISILAGLVGVQIALAVSYYPKSIRRQVGYSEKVASGSLPFLSILYSMIRVRRSKVDGVFHPESTCYIGLVGLFCAIMGATLPMLIVLTLFIVLAMGRRTPVWRLVHPFMLRIPARWCYFVSVTLVCLAVRGFSNLTTNVALLFILFQCMDLCLRISSLWPMEPFTQRWEKPSKAFSKPYLSLFKEPWRVSGLTFPQRTGHVTHTRTLGYTGGAQLTAMARFRHDSNPDGSGLHDWLQSDNTQEDANWFGVRWAITYRPLHSPWKPTQFRHVYENTEVLNDVPGWKELGNLYDRSH